jgi:hypothetical protein
VSSSAVGLFCPKIMPASSIPTIDQKSQEQEADKLYCIILTTDRRKQFLDQAPQADYTFETSEPDALDTQLCREPGNRREYRQFHLVTLMLSCLLVKLTSKQLFNQMQKRIVVERQAQLT